MEGEYGGELYPDMIIDRGLPEGTVKLHVVKCGVSGPPFTGKTHVRALMINSQRPCVPQSTAVATEADQVTPHGGRLVTEDVKNMRKTCKGSLKWQSVDMPRFIANTLHNEDYAGTRSLSSLRKQRRANNKIINDIKKHLKGMKGKPKGKRRGLNEICLVYFVDVGGQPQFQEILQNFIRCDINFLVHNLSEKLSDCPEFKYFFDGKNFTVPQAMMTSNIEIIEQSVRSICSTMSLSTESKPHVAILGTHKDKFNADSDDYSEMMKGKSKEISERLKPYIGTSKLNKCELITPSRDQCIFALDCSAEGWKKNDDAIDSLKQNVLNYAENLYIEVPIRYFVFLQILTVHAEKKRLQYLTLKQCISVATEGDIFMTESDVVEALKLFDECNIVLYFSRILPSIVFIKPVFLFSRTTDLIVSSFQMENCLMSEDHVQFQKSGIFTKNLLVKIKSLRFTDKNFTLQNFLDLLKALYIITEVSDGSYFMPCVLPVSISPSEQINSIQHSMKGNGVDGPLCISFTHEKSPRGLFCALLVALAGDSNWKLSTLTEHLLRCRNLVEFEVYNKSGSIGEVIIIDKNSHLEIYTTCDCSECSYIKHTVHKAFEKARDSMRYSHNDLDFIGLPCEILPECKSSHSTKVFCSKNVWKERCPVNRKQPIILSPERLVWFSNSTTPSK